MLRQHLVRLLLVSLSYVSVLIPLAALPGSIVDFWYLFFSPVLISALSFGLKGAISASAATVITFAVLMNRFQELLFLAPRDSLERIALLAATQGAGFRQILVHVAPLLAGSRDAALAVAAIEPLGDVMFTTAKVGLGTLSIIAVSMVVGWQVDRRLALDDMMQQLALTDSLTGLWNRRVFR